MLLFFPVIIFLCYLLIPIGQRVDSALRFPFEMDGEEGFVFLDAVTVRTHQPLYQSIETEPYVVGNYPPLFAWALSCFIDPDHPSLRAGRLIVAVSSILIVQLLILIVFSRTRRLIPSFLAPLLFLVTYEFHNWSAFCRVDLPALALTLLGLYIFINTRRLWGTYLSALVFVLAAFTRVTSVLAPAACCLSMLLYDRRRLAWFLIPYLGLGVGAFAIFDYATGGEFYRHVVVYNRNEMDWDQLRLVMKNEVFYFYRWWIAALAAEVLASVFVWSHRRSSDGGGKIRFRSPPHARGVTGFYFVLASLSLITFAKVGSAPNYALEPLAAAALFGPELLGRLCDAGGGERSSRRALARAGVLGMAAALLLHIWYLREVAANMFSSRNPSSTDVDVGRAVLDAVHNADGDVLTEYPLFSLLCGKPITYEPFIMSRLAAEGLWDEQKIIDQISRHRFGLILTSQDLRDVEKGVHLWRFTPKVARSILRYYSLQYVAHAPGGHGLRLAYYLWLPKPAGKAEPTENFIALSEEAIRPRGPAPVADLI